MRAFGAVVVALAILFISVAATEAVYLKFRESDETFLVEDGANATSDFEVETNAAVYLAANDYYNIDTPSPTLRPTRERVYLRATSSPTAPPILAPDWAFLGKAGAPPTTQWGDEPGVDVTVYMLDTGCDASHPMFVNTSIVRESFVYGEGVDDLQGHGTHVAGIVYAASLRAAQLVCYKVFDQFGTGTTETIVRAALQVGKKCVGKRCVINLSGGAFNSRLLQKVAKTLVLKRGVAFIAAVGNRVGGACNFSPGNAAWVVGVGACDAQVALASFSGWGSCARVFSFGDSIVSAVPQWPGWAVKSGTSMSTAVVTGIATYVMREEPDIRAYPDVYDIVVRNAAKVVRGVPDLGEGGPLAMYDAWTSYVANVDKSARTARRAWTHEQCLSFSAKPTFYLYVGTEEMHVAADFISTSRKRVQRNIDNISSKTYKIVRDFASQRTALLEDDEYVFAMKGSDERFAFGKGVFDDIERCNDSVPAHTPCHQLTFAECRRPCVWHGTQTGCRRASYCDFKDANACRRSSGCYWAVGVPSGAPTALAPAPEAATSVLGTGAGTDTGARAVTVAGGKGVCMART